MSIKVSKRDEFLAYGASVSLADELKSLHGRIAATKHGASLNVGDIEHKIVWDKKVKAYVFCQDHFESYAKRPEGKHAKGRLFPILVGKEHNKVCVITKAKKHKKAWYETRKDVENLCARVITACEKLDNPKQVPTHKAKSERVTQEPFTSLAWEEMKKKFQANPGSTNLFVFIKQNRDKFSSMCPGAVENAFGEIYGVAARHISFFSGQTDLFENLLEEMNIWFPKSGEALGLDALKVREKIIHDVREFSKIMQSEPEPKVSNAHEISSQKPQDAPLQSSQNALQKDLPKETQDSLKIIQPSGESVRLREKVPEVLLEEEVEMNGVLC